MKTRRVTRYIADCGKGFWDKKSCVRHEENCKCWTNPAFRTCKTCKFASVYQDSNGMEDNLQCLQTWTVIECTNPKFKEDKHFTAAHENALDLNVNCPVWEGKKEFKGSFKYWKI